MTNVLRQITTGQLLNDEQAYQLAAVPATELPALLTAATLVREQAFGTKVSLCAIVNAKSGLCPEDCAFCAQSAHHATTVAQYPLLDEQTLLENARRAAACGAGCYGIVTSGSGIRSGEELDRICSVIRKIRAEGLIAPGASLGTLDAFSVHALKDAGLVTYHHNLETSRSFFPQICSTHDYEDDVATVRLAKQAGLRVCSGGLFGLGESMAQRVELALTLRELDVDSVPINFLDPVDGTPLAGSNNLSPLECLHIIALFRLIIPKAHITVCGGREKNLRDLQSWIFMAGASGIMTGNYLTKEGRQPSDDRQMIADLGLTLTEGLVR
jgi:biotin synthase